MMADQSPVAPSGAGTNVTFTQALSVEQTTETGVLLSDRNWQRIIDKLEACKERGLAEIWIAVGGIALGGAIAAGIGIITLPPSAVSHDRGYLIMIIVFGIILTAICALGYFITREKNNKAIEMIIGDMLVQRPFQEGYVRAGGRTKRRSRSRNL
jgi:hypothetical protein